MPRAAPSRRRGPLGTDFVRTSILSGAATIFARKGVAQTNVEEILVASGISRRTFYRLFRSKEEVLAALFDSASTLFVRAFERAVAEEATPAEKLARGVDTYLELTRSAGPLMRVLFGESQRTDSPLAVRRREVIDDLVALLAREAEVFVGHPVEPLLLQGLLAGLEVMAMSVLKDRKPTPRDTERARAAMQRLVAATLAGEGALLPPLPKAPSGSSLFRRGQPRGPRRAPRPPRRA